MRTPTIGFFGLFGVGNLGNEASLRAAVRAVADRVPDARLVVVSADPARTAAEHGLRSVPIGMDGDRSWYRSRGRLVRVLLRPAREIASSIRTYRFLRTVDAVIVPGTGILDDFGIRPHQLPLDLLRWTTLARLARKKWAFVSVGAGPADNRWSRRCFRRSAALATWCSFRDGGSREFMARLDPRHRTAPVYPDLAYTLPTPSTPPDPRRPATAIGVMTYYGWQGDPEKGAQLHDQYIDALTDLVRRQQRRGVDVVLLIGDGVDGAAADAIMQAVEPGAGDGQVGTVRCPSLITMNDVFDAVGGCDIVAASRFHNVVAALMMHRPVVSLGYSTKFDELLHDVGLAGYTHDIEQLDVDSVERDIEDLRQRASTVTATLGRVLTEYRTRLESQYDELVAALELVPAPAAPLAANA